MRMRKDNIVKNIPENLISVYKSMGWKEETEKKSTSFVTPSTPDKN